MYYKNDANKSFFEFNESCGMQLDKTNKFILVANNIPWDNFADEYIKLFPSSAGRPSYSFRTAICTLILKAYTNLSDRKIVEAIQENPYYQYFIGMKEFSSKKPFGHTTVINFRKRITPVYIASLIDNINNFLTKQMDNNFGKEEGQVCIESYSDDEINLGCESKNLGTAILDATCSPSNIKYPKDYALLNDARKITEKMIDKLYAMSGKEGIKPKTYRRRLDKKYLEVAKQRRNNAKKTRSLIRNLLNALKRNLGYIEKYNENGYCLSDKEKEKLTTLKELYKQQHYMFINKTHKVKDRIVSIDQPYIRPIIRGKAKSPVEFGAKYDVSIDSTGLARLEKISFDPYNEGSILKKVIERYKDIHGYYPERVLVDQIYRTRENINYCTSKNIVLSGPKLGRPRKTQLTRTQKLEEKKNNTDRIEVERFFSTTKRVYGANLIKTRLKDTTYTTIGFTILAANLFTVMRDANIFLYFFIDLDACKKKISTIWFVDSCQE